MQWWFVSLPPVPAQATEMETYYPPNGRERETHFKIDRVAQDVQSFYQTALPNAGWHYYCTVQAHNRCAHMRNLSDAAIIDVYYKTGAEATDEQRIEVLIMNDDVTAVVGKRPVLIYEQR